jgi:Tol biopolymer transport system component
MDPTRRAAVEQLHQTTTAELALPRTPNPDAVAPTAPPLPTATLATGIYTDCFEGGERVVLTRNCWSAIVDDTYLFVRAGALAADMQQGVIVVARNPLPLDRDSSGDWSIYATPASRGAVRVLEVSDQRLTLSAEDGTQFVFDLATRTWAGDQLPATPILLTPTPHPIVAPTVATSITARQAHASAAGRIAFTSRRAGRDAIYVMQADGSEQTLLTNPDLFADYPTWSPDGRQIAYLFALDGAEIYRMDADGSNQVQLTDNEWWKENLAWSPDGTRIAFNAGYDIYIIDDATSGVINLTQDGPDGSYKDSLPAWSPTGDAITFTSNRDGQRDIYVMQADGTNQTRLTTDVSDEWEPAWSPDGTRIVFTSNRDGNPEIYVMQADGTNQTRLTTQAADDTNPAWSSDSSQIAFTSNRDGNPEIYVMQADGTNQTRLTYNSANDTRPAWSP